MAHSTSPNDDSRLRRELTRFGQFLLVGVLAASLDFVILNLLQATILAPEGEFARRIVLLASTISYVCGVTFSFVANRIWIYRTTQGKLRFQFAQFFSVYVVSLGVRLAVIALMFPFWRSALIEFAPALSANKLASNLAQATAIGATMLWNFSINRLWTFGDVE